jgi:hypothetical protein
MSIQNESDHTQLDELRQTVVDLSTKIEVLSETIRKGKTDLIYKLMYNDIIVVVLSWPRSYGKFILIYIYLCNQCLSTLQV